MIKHNRSVLFYFACNSLEVRVMGEKARIFRVIIEAVGVLGVICSLTFVGLEIRQNTIATKAANDLAVSDAFREVNLAMATSPELVHALVEAAQNPEAMSLEDETLAKAWWRALFHTWSNTYRQHMNDTLDPALWASVTQEISAYSGKAPAGESHDNLAGRGRSARWAWQSERYVYSPDFQAYVDEAFGVKQ